MMRKAAPSNTMMIIIQETKKSMSTTIITKERKSIRKNSRNLFLKQIIETAQLLSINVNQL